MELPLAGIRVVDFTRLLPGPHCTLLLADLGAEVVKIEDTSSPDYLRYLPPYVAETNVSFAWLNRGKRSVALDLRQAEGAAAARRLAERADVVVESFRPGRMAALGLDADTLARANPRGVYCSLTGFGHHGPFATRAGHDIGYIARAGVASTTGTPSASAVLPGVQIADVGGALHAALAIVTALLGRERGIEIPRHLDVSLTDCAMAMLSMHAAEALATGQQPPPGQGILSGRAPAYRYYRCADGGLLAVGAIEPKFWARLCEVVGLDDAGDHGLVLDDHADALHARLEARFAERSREAWLAALSDVDCCVEPVLSIEEAFGSPLAEARGMTVTVSVGGEPVRQPACPLRFGGATPLCGPATLGADTRALLLEVGYEEAELDRLSAAGAITG